MTDDTQADSDARERSLGAGGRDARVESLLLDLLGTPSAPVIAVMEVHSQTAGDIQVRPMGARDMDPFTARGLAGVEATFGDLAICVRAANIWYVVNVVGEPEDKPALASHQHYQGDPIYATVIGEGTTVVGNAVYSTFVSSDSGEIPGTDRVTAVGALMRSLGSRAIALGHYVQAGLRSVGIGTGAAASGDESIAIGDTAWASASRSIAIGTDAVASVADEAVLRAKRLVLTRPDGLATYTRIDLQDGAGNRRALAVDTDDSFYVQGRRYGTYPGYFPNNKTVGSGGPFNFRSAPVVSTANVIGSIASGTAIHDSGYRFDEGGFNWAYVFWHPRGFGYLLSSSVV